MVLVAEMQYAVIQMVITVRVIALDQYRIDPFHLADVIGTVSARDPTHLRSNPYFRGFDARCHPIGRPRSDTDTTSTNLELTDLCPHYSRQSLVYANG